MMAFTILCKNSSTIAPIPGDTMMAEVRESRAEIITNTGQCTRQTGLIAMATVLHVLNRGSNETDAQFPNNNTARALNANESKLANTTLTPSGILMPGNRKFQKQDP